MSNSTNESKYFDLHTTGIGYLNRIREVKPRKGNPFMAVTVAAILRPAYHWYWLSQPHS
ncbi:DUF3577 domain-containing protein [Pseudomonas amygdali]|uniref:DUF3577 domain-containing protein n=1 Tax=Pseudomonas amygdali TaxID=47877 RepID=UPI000A784C3D|nr:DUF3577 domain-containing protein [Pseudomonas amygdali]